MPNGQRGRRRQAVRPHTRSQVPDRLEGDVTRHGAALALATRQETQLAGVVVARDLSRRYGAGETAVDALKGVSLVIPAAT